MRRVVCLFWLGGVLLSAGATAQQIYPGAVASGPDAQFAQLRQIVLEQSQQLQQLRAEIQRLSGEVEVIHFNQEQATQRQRDVQADFDKRLARLESQPAVPPDTALSVPPGTLPPPAEIENTQAAPPAMPVPPQAGTVPPAAPPAQAVVAPPAAATDQEKSAYEQAFGTLQGGRYHEAIASFEAILKTYPQGQYADNAQYWIGESYYAMREFPAALHAFDKLLKAYPNSPKRSHALLKMGYVHAELNDKGKARQVLEEVRNTYPGTASARLAEERLQRLGQ